MGKLQHYTKEQLEEKLLSAAETIDFYADKKHSAERAIQHVKVVNSALEKLINDLKDAHARYLIRLKAIEEN